MPTWSGSANQGLSSSGPQQTNARRPPRAQRAGQIAKRADRVAEEHHAEARDQRDRGSRARTCGSGRRRECSRTLPWPRSTQRRRASREQRLRDVDREHRAVRADRGGELQGGGARAAADVDHALAGADARPRRSAARSAARTAGRAPPDSRSTSAPAPSSSTRPDRRSRGDRAGESSAMMSPLRLRPPRPAAPARRRDRPARAAPAPACARPS